MIAHTPLGPNHTSPPWCKSLVPHGPAHAQTVRPGGKAVQPSAAAPSHIKSALTASRSCSLAVAFVRAACVRCPAAVVAAGGWGGVGARRVPGSDRPSAARATGAKRQGLWQAQTVFACSTLHGYRSTVHSSCWRHGFRGTAAVAQQLPGPRAEYGSGQFLSSQPRTPYGHRHRCTTY